MAWQCPCLCHSVPPSLRLTASASRPWRPSLGAAMRRRIRGMLLSGRQFSLDSRIDLVQGSVQQGAAQGAPPPELPLMREDSVEANSEHDSNHQHHCGKTNRGRMPDLCRPRGVRPRHGLARLGLASALSVCPWRVCARLAWRRPLPDPLGSVQPLYQRPCPWFSGSAPVQSGQHRSRSVDVDEDLPAEPQLPQLPQTPLRAKVPAQAAVPATPSAH